MANSIAGDIILSIRDQIPDPPTTVGDYTKDGTDFSLATIMRWLNDAQRAICSRANVISDWFAVASAIGMDVYELPSYVTSIDEAWYNLIPLSPSPELNDIYITKLVGRSWWFGSHSVHSTPKIHLWPACDTKGGVTTLSQAIGTTDTVFTINPNLSNGGPINQLGYFLIDSELILYRNYDAKLGTVTNVLRGQGGTLKAAHALGAPVVEQNILLKGFRQAVKLNTPDEIIEIPQGLWPLLELYVLSKVRSAEQDTQSAKSLMDDFNKAVDTIAAKRQGQTMVQGMQVRTEPPSPSLFMGHLFIK